MSFRTTNSEYMLQHLGVADKSLDLEEYQFISQNNYSLTNVEIIDLAQ